MTTPTNAAPARCSCDSRAARSSAGVEQHAVDDEPHEQRLDHLEPGAEERQQEDAGDRVAVRPQPAQVVAKVLAALLLLAAAGFRREDVVRFVRFRRLVQLLPLVSVDERRDSARVRSRVGPSAFPDDLRDPLHEVETFGPVGRFGPSRSVSTFSASCVPTAAMRCTVNVNSCGSFESAASASARGMSSGDQRLGRVPHHQRLVLIARVLAVREQAGDDVPALRRPARAAARWRGTAAPAPTCPCCASCANRRSAASATAALPSTEQVTAQLRTYSLSCAEQLERDPARVSPSVTCSAHSARSLRVTSGFVCRMRLSARVHRRIGAALLQEAPRVAHVPVVAVQLQLDQLRSTTASADRPARSWSFAWLILKMRPSVLSWTSGLLLWHWFLSYQSMT